MILLGATFQISNYEFPTHIDHLQTNINNSADELDELELEFRRSHMNQMHSVVSFPIINMDWQWRRGSISYPDIADRGQNLCPDDLADSRWGWASLSHEDTERMQDFFETIDESATDSYVGCKIFLSPHYLDVYEYTVDWIRTGNFAVAFSKPWLDRGDNYLESIICKPVRMQVFCPHVTLNEHGNARVCLLSAFSGEEVCSQVVSPNKAWCDVMRCFDQPFVRMGFSYPEIRAIRLQTRDGEKIDVDEIMQIDVDLMRVQKRQRIEEQTTFIH